MRRVCETAILEGGISGENLFLGHHSIIRNGFQIGHNVMISHLCTVEENVKIGDSTRIQANCYITRGTVIGDSVFIGPGVTTTNDKEILSHGREPDPELCPPTFERGCRVGAGTVILPGITIGENAMVGAGSIVTCDIPPGELWYGVPATFKREVPARQII